ncbi:glutamate--tRNA ligase [Treponema pallidum]|nr:glutamate--tRNA ligase [Treponema pallidum]
MEVRVRYAPSPTGLQHIGGIRTALFNFLFARAHAGVFVLRVEDTDRSRCTAAFEQNLYDTLRWLGVSWDEGGGCPETAVKQGARGDGRSVAHAGGAYGPYTQSARTDLYRAQVARLVETGQAYYCFCDASRLERVRKIRTLNRMPPGYDRHCRELLPEEVRECLASGVPHVIRFKVPLEGSTHFRDALLGDIEWQNEEINPDPILLKSDGFPTYHLANVVDDHAMRITHVLRAQEWVPSTPLHLLLYRAFGWQPPLFCHLPMVMGADGHKLSKRHGATSCDEFRNAGYLPEALLNYVAMLGCSYGEGQDLFTREQLCAHFSLSRLNKSPAVFDYKKLAWFNGQYIRAKSDEQLCALVWPFIANAGVCGHIPADVEAGAVRTRRFADEAPCAPTEAQRSMLMRVIPLIKERLRFLTDAPELVRCFFQEPSLPEQGVFVPKRLDVAQVRAVLVRARGLVHEIVSASEPDVEVLFRAEAEKFGIKLGDFLMPIRVALTGATVSAPLVGTIRILGASRSCARIEHVIRERFSDDSQGVGGG